MNFVKINYLIFSIVLFTLSLTGSGQKKPYTLSTDSLVNFHASNNRIYNTVRTRNKPRIDGRLDDACWKKEGYWDGEFIQQVPDQGRAPTQKTEVKILYDENNLYVALKCYDKEPAKISPLLGRRDDFTSGDAAGIALDTYFDKLTAFEFNVTAAGQKIDLTHLGAYQWDTNWNAVWEGKTQILDSMWSVEMAIPFSQLRFSDQNKQVWGMHIWRWLDRLDEEDQWKLIPIDAPAMVYIFGELHGIENIKRNKRFELMPFSAFRYIKGNTKDRFGAGLDGKVSLTSNLTLDYTVLPDFGQVEADPSELNLSAYEVFYEEKRPFFLEGNAILNYTIGNDLLFYSRRIGHTPSFTPDIAQNEVLSMPSGTSILDALKITGQSKKGVSVGLINSMTSKEFADISQGDITTRMAIEPFTNFSVGRISKDMNNGNTHLGAMATSTYRLLTEEHLKFLPGEALVGGIDLLHNWNNREYFIDVKSFYSYISGSPDAISRLQLSNQHLFQRTDADHLTFDPEKTALSGWGGQVRGGKQSGKFRVTGTLNWRSPGVDLNDAGYMRDADLIIERLNLRYQVNKPAGILRNWYVYFDQRHDWTFGSENINNNLNLHGYVKFSNLWSLHLDGIRNFGKFDTRQLRGGPSLCMDPYSISELFLQTNSADKIFLGAGVDKKWVDHQLGDAIDFTFYLQWKISNRFSLTSRTNYEIVNDNSQYIGQKTISSQTRYIIGKIHRETLYTTLRAEFFVTPELSLQFYGSPYASTGDFLQIRKVNDPHAESTAQRFKAMSQIPVADNKIYLDEDNNGLYDFWIMNPDFNFKEFRSNFVLRWEYKAGSTLYFVWSHNRSSYETGYNKSIFDSFADIRKVHPDNALMVKLSYWFSL
jgi:hypothetical protein